MLLLERPDIISHKVPPLCAFKDSSKNAHLHIDGCRTHSLFCSHLSVGNQIFLRMGMAVEFQLLRVLGDLNHFVAGSRALCDCVGEPGDDGVFEPFLYHLLLHSRGMVRKLRSKVGNSA